MLFNSTKPTVKRAYELHLKGQTLSIEGFLVDELHWFELFITKDNTVQAEDIFSLYVEQQFTISISSPGLKYSMTSLL